MKTPGLSASALEPRTYAPANVCIYCGLTPPANLTKEHIVPQGLGGGYVLPKSSCDACRLKTHEFETDVLRKDLLAFRARAKIHTRRPKQRPKALPLATTPTGPTILVPTEEHPMVLALPRFGYPGLLTGGDPAQPYIPIKTSVWASPIELDAVAERLGGEGVRLDQSVHVIAFARMLAKIAHGIAWAQCGPAAFEPWLPDRILGKRHGLAYVVGEAEKPVTDDVPPNGPLHLLCIRHLSGPSQNFLTVAIQLFAPYRGPTYYVVVGPTKLSRDELTLLAEQGA